MNGLSVKLLGVVLCGLALVIAGCSVFGPTGQDKSEADALSDELQGYKSWKSPPGYEDLETSVGHSGAAFVKYYVNPTAMASFDDPKPGSIIVKEQYNKDKELQNFTVMKKIEGYNSEAADWYWAIANKSAVVTDGGTIASCISCHKKGDGGGDLLFVND